MVNFNLSYREVLPDLSNSDNFKEIVLHTGGAQSTLQDIKIAEKAGGYCYKNVVKHHLRNRYIYWRTHHDVLELSEISLDNNLYENNVRYKFTDSPVLSVTINEGSTQITILVTTVCSLHRINFPHPDVTGKTDIGETRTFSVFRDASHNATIDPSTFYVIGQNTSPNNPIPHAATSYLTPEGTEAYFALAHQSSLVLYKMDCQSGQTVSNVLKEHNIMPRLFSNLKGALIGKSNNGESDIASSFVFNRVNEQTYLMVLYRDDQLRMWSTSTMQSVCSVNCVRETLQPRIQGPQTNALRKINETYMCAFLSQSTGSEFVILRVLEDNGPNLSIVRTRTVPAPQSDLADFDVSESRIWALWCNAEGEFSISNFSLIRCTGLNWISAAMEPPPDRFGVGSDQAFDPRQLYCNYIFHPGKFERNVISKALVMFRRSNALFDANVPYTILKDRVCQAIENEIQNEIKDFEVTDDEYLDISTRLWERFYSCCEQYHLKACQPIGLVILDPIDAVCVVKKSTFSLLRPCESLEHLMLAGEDVVVENVVAAHFPDNINVGEDLIQLVTILVQIENWLPDFSKTEINNKLYQLEMPNVVISKMVDDILSGNSDKEILPPNFMVLLRQKLHSITDLRASMELLLDSLRMDHGNPEGMHTHSDIANSSRFLFSIGSLFGSSVGISILSESVRQISMIRLAICRDLMILQQILVDTFSLSCEMLEIIRSQFMPQTGIFLQSYYVMVWISETTVHFGSSSTIESSIQRLNMLHLTDGSIRPLANSGQFHSSPLLRVFLANKGLCTALSLFKENSNQPSLNPQWQNTLIPLTTIISQLIWPVSFNFVFGEWLLSTCQHIIIEDYVRLLNSWCEWNMCSRQFILAISLLDSGESHKSYDLFLQSAKGVFNEQFMSDKILKLDEDLSNDQAIAVYYLKVIQLFEQHNALDYVISLAQVAIGILENGDPQLPMFQSIVFNNHLILEHYEEAYHSLIYNSEQSRRKDCLRQLMVTLFNKKKLDLLMHFPYVGLQDEFENIVESRARSMGIEENDIYDFLYAFHIVKGNMRKASSITYEHAMRLQLESDSMESMKKRYDCLLICINAMELIDDRYRWIAKPVINDEFIPSTTSIEDVDIDDAIIKEQVIVLQVKDIRKELLQTEALLSLSKHRRDVGTFLNAGAKELVVILSNCGLYTAALKLARGFEISELPIFDSLAASCVRTADEHPTEPWSWLQENDLADLPHKNNAAEMAWSLLRKLILDNEQENTTNIRKSVVNKLLSLNAFIPQWLYSSYKTDNSSELLRLFVMHSRLLEATELTTEIIWAMLGPGSEYFNFKHPIAVTSPSMCIPINIIDLLLHGLKLNQNEIEYRRALTDLEELLQSYLNTAARISDDKIQLAHQLVKDRQNI